MSLQQTLSASGFAIALLTLHSTTTTAQAGSRAAMTLVVDETQAARRITFVHEELSVAAGPLDLVYPKWIPGEHGPVGPIQQVAALQIRAGQTMLAWKRDPGDIYTF